MNTITILPLGAARRELLEGLCAPLEATFRARINLDTGTIDAERFYDPMRVQYNSTKALQYLQAVHPFHTQATGSEPDKVIAVTAEDLFIPILTFVFGEAMLGGVAAVVSYHRLRNELYGLPVDADLLSQRLRKEAFHELGHTYGLVHCLNPECVMHASTYVEEIDLKSEFFCPVCIAELHPASN